MENLFQNQSLANKWLEYNRVRQSGAKKKANQILNEFIADLKFVDKTQIKKFVDGLCEAVLDNNQILYTNVNGQIQYPLYKDIVLPILFDEYRNHSPIHIRWIGQFNTNLYSNILEAKNLLIKLKIIESESLESLSQEEFIELLSKFDNLGSLYFFKKSYSLEKAEKTNSLILNKIADRISFYIHELPWGVLATPDRYEEILNDFAKYLTESENKEQWKSEYEYWREIGCLWREYKSSGNNYRNFKDCLLENNFDW